MILPERWPHCFFKNYKTLNYLNVFLSFDAPFTKLKHTLRSPIKQCSPGLRQECFVLRSSPSLNQIMKSVHNQNPIPEDRVFSESHFEKENINCLFKVILFMWNHSKCFMLCLKLYKAYQDICYASIRWISNIACVEWFYEWISSDLFSKSSHFN